MSENQPKICDECNSKIVGQSITFKNKTYHEDCFNKKFICSVCDNPITDGKVITSESGRLFHTGCFKCEGCSKMISGSEGYAERDSKIYCKDCGYKLHQEDEEKNSVQGETEICSVCGEKIIGKVLSALDCSFHFDCFRCKKCDKPFEEINFQLEDGYPYHPGCFNSEFGKKCAGCNKLITGNYLNALEKEWHNECFVCGGCKKPIRGSFFDKQGQPYCEGCGKSYK
ncbi:paxillin-b [Anaeramoeba flamelloides]|uniref:Paxillin-b n=1 Tax=Anaeramoeba flamelloides TaxID=1746091 RepID=A0AAV7YNP3_9EUKA|nr:paxillin-b [Anaeramoeba flamelloides]|eukprot:Anaeramoba_flamelloidesa570924_173.p1 GENE.a570924_173~~a570924_173.p1  ORF type:complete len:227 (-),score=51.87 a570924_173:4-684(-)